nr:7809_t:CDS:2 [Entrophospora candida]
MTNKELEAQRQTILHYWLNGILTVKHIDGNCRRSMVTRTASRSIGQLVHHNSAITTRQLAVRIQETHNVFHMAKKGYNSAIPLSTPTLTRTVTLAVDK